MAIWVCVGIGDIRSLNKNPDLQQLKRSLAPAGQCQSEDRSWRDKRDTHDFLSLQHSRSRNRRNFIGRIKVRAIPPGIAILQLKGKRNDEDVIEDLQDVMQISSHDPRGMEWECLANLQLVPTGYIDLMLLNAYSGTRLEGKIRHLPSFPKRSLRAAHNNFKVGWWKPGRQVLERLE